MAGAGQPGYVQAMGPWTYDESAGELLVLTGVEGPAAWMGHALTLRWHGWHAEVDHDAGRPTAVRVTVPVDGLEVVHGEGGFKGLSTPEKALVRRRALKELAAEEHREIGFEADSVSSTGSGWLLDGTLRIRGRALACAVEVRDDGGTLSAETTLRQTDVHVPPVRFLGGAFSVADEVRVRLTGVAVPAEGYDGPTG
jgi:polyisoprenoid-binding protein YceI